MSESRFFRVRCPACRWTGSSEDAAGGGPIADTGDYDDIYCPVCYDHDSIALEQLPDLSREYIGKAIAAIPWWKRMLICWVLDRKQWKIARAYNEVTIHAVHTLGDYELFEQMRTRGDREWAKLYDL